MVKIKNIPGALIEKRKIDYEDEFQPWPSKYNAEHYNLAITEIGEREITLNREKITELINKVELGNFEHINKPRSSDYEKGMVDATKIINEMYKMIIIPKIVERIIAGESDLLEFRGGKL